MNPKTMAYRPEIDGLRAICVLGVILFHANLGVSGGFVGVDVFFVISGFLISKIVLEEIRDGRFSLIGFWERRIRRIFPAVAFMQVTVLVLGFFLYFPVDYHNLLVASRYLVLGVPNFHYWRSLDYFSDSVTMFPLLHTWSLGVEEQFYVVFPVVILVLARKCPRLLLPVMLAGAIVSFGVSLHQVRNDHAATAFFLLPARAWELLAGCILTLWNPLTKLSPGRRETLSALGLGGILFSMIRYDEQMEFPGPNALLPVIAACAFIAANAPGMTLSGRMLASPAFVSLGKMSFSLYLWHWPLIALANLYFPEERWLGPACALVCLPIAIFALRHIEEPFRKRQVCVTRRSVFRFFVAANVAVLAFVQLGQLTNGFHQRVDALPEPARKIYRQSLEDFTFVSAGNGTQEDLLAGRTELLGANARGGPTFFLWGDSHAMAVSQTFDEVAREFGLSGLYAYAPGLDLVPPRNMADYPLRNRKPNSTETNARILERVVACGIRDIVLVSRWSYHLDYPDGAGDFAAFVRFLREKAPDVTIHVVQEVPRQRYVRRTFFYQSFLDEAFGWPFVFRPTDRRDYQALTGAFESAMATVCDPRVRRIDVDDRFFDAQGLLRHREGPRSFYVDEDHLSRYGSERLMRPVIETLLRRIQEGVPLPCPEKPADGDTIAQDPVRPDRHRMLRTN